MQKFIYHSRILDFTLWWEIIGHFLVGEYHDGNLCFERITTGPMWRIDSRESGVDAGQPRKDNCNSAGKICWWLQIGRWHPTPGSSQNQLDSWLNITSDRLNMSCEKENKNDVKVLGLSNWMNGDRIRNR